ncbi:MAG: hypothetical protein AAB441_05125 [Patescibacteria group bacterium]
MISFKPYYDVHTGRRARFSKSYTVEEARKLVKNFEGKINLFEDYYFGWYLKPLKQNLREGTLLITTAILLSFCEVLEQFQKGENSNFKTNEFVKTYLKRIYRKNIKKIDEKIIEKIVDKIYNTLRNGLHHDLTTRGVNIIISDGVKIVYEKNDVDIVKLWFNPLHFLDIVTKEFLKYTKKLRDKSYGTLRSNFEKIFDKFFTFYLSKL